MIIDNTYFKGDIYIPHAKPSITDSVQEIETSILDFINEYARECLLKCLGHQLFNELSDNLDSTQPDGLSIAADEKWDDLLNGAQYTNPDTGEAVTWRGIRFKSTPLGEYDKSFLANYVYFFYERNDYITRSDAGHQIENSKNSFGQTPTLKVVTSWNKFVELVQGSMKQPQYIFKGNLLGVDFYNVNKNQEISLYQFINDSNKIAENTYANFNPHMWSKMNRFGL